MTSLKESKTMNHARIEAAARALAEMECLDLSELGEQFVEEYLDQVRIILAAAFPELASDPPKAWLAPIEATEALLDVIFFNEGNGNWLWRKLRDAHLKDSPA